MLGVRRSLARRRGLVVPHKSFNRDPEEIATFGVVFREKWLAISGGERSEARSATEIASTLDARGLRLLGNLLCVAVNRKKDVWYDEPRGRGDITFLRHLLFARS